MTIVAVIPVDALRPELPEGLICSPHPEHWAGYRTASGAELLYHAGWRRGAYLPADRDTPTWVDDCSLTALARSADQDSPLTLT